MSVLIQPQWVQITATSVYINGQSTSQIIDKFEARNDNAATQTLTVYLVPSGTGTPDNSHIRLSVPIASTQTYLCGEIVGHDLDPGDSIWLLATLGLSISVRCSGRTR